MRQPGILAALTVLILLTPGYAQDHGGEPPDRRISFVAATGAFEFHSDPLLNLHDFLLWSTQSEERVDARPQCLARLPSADREAFERARVFYERTFSERSRFDPLIMALRWELAGFTAVAFVPDSALAPALAQLRAAAPAYRSCWWTDHDTRNRAWVAELVPRLILYEDTLLARLSRLYGDEWGGPFPVDVVGHAGRFGANTVVNPDHILMSSTNPGYRGDSALEMVFHEAAHTLSGSGQGTVWHALRTAAAALNAEQLPEDLGHPIIFYTTGKVVDALLAERGVRSYEPYAYREGLFERAWPQLRAPLERHWLPYLENRIDLDEAARRLLEAVAAVARH